MGLAVGQRHPGPLPFPMHPPKACPKAPGCGPDQRMCTKTPRMPNPPPCGPPPPPMCPHDFCIPMTERNNNGIECQKDCPKDCGMNEKWCHGGYDESGCEMQGVCLPKPQCGPEPECPPSLFDPEGCPVEPVCNPEFEQVCHLPPKSPKGPKGPKGLKGPKCGQVGYCSPKFHLTVRDKNGDKCPRQCPTVCPPMTKVCPGHFDANGCPGPESCHPDMPGVDNCPKPEFNSRGCKVHDIPDCSPENKLCPIGADENGCHMGFKMVPRDANCPQVQLPPMN